MALSVSCKCCTLISASAEWCSYLCFINYHNKAVTHVIDHCALIPNLVHLCYTLIPELLCYPSCGTDCQEYDNFHWDLITYNQISHFWFDSFFVLLLWSLLVVLYIFPLLAYHKGMPFWHLLPLFPSQGVWHGVRCIRMIHILIWEKQFLHSLFHVPW